MGEIDLAWFAGCNAQYFRYPFDRFVEVQRRLGLNRIEFWASTPHLWCDHIECEPVGAVKAALDAADLTVAAYSPKPYNYSLCAPMGTPQRAATLGYYRQSIAAAAEMGAPYVCLSPAGGCFDHPRDESWECCRAALEELCAEAGRRGVALLLGTVMQGESLVLGTLDELARMLSEVGSPALGALLDTAVISARGESIPQWFGLLGAAIRHVRFSDGRNAGWRSWGEGVLPCARYLRQLEESGYAGALSLFIGGERYYTDPAGADQRGMRWLSGSIREEGGTA